MYQVQETFLNVLEATMSLQTVSKSIALVDDNPDGLPFLRREVRFIFGDVPVMVFHNGTDLIRHLHCSEIHYRRSANARASLEDLQA